MMTVAPVPICANKGPGHAPVMAQPRPKKYPTKDLPPIEFFLVKFYGFAMDGFDVEFLIKSTETRPTAMALPMTPYIWKD